MPFCYVLQEMHSLIAQFGVLRGTTLEMKGEGVSWSDPEKTIQYRHVTVYSNDSFSYTMHLTEDGEEREVMWIEMNRKAAE